MKECHQSKVDCDDIRDIAIRVQEYNADENISFNQAKDKLIMADINSLYDSITKQMVVWAFNYAINELLPPLFITRFDCVLAYKYEFYV